MMLPVKAASLSLSASPPQENLLFLWSLNRWLFPTLGLWGRFPGSLSLFHLRLPLDVTPIANNPNNHCYQGQNGDDSDYYREQDGGVGCHRGSMGNRWETDHHI